MFNFFNQNSESDNLHKLIGAIIEDCQAIEHDIKIIYASMLKGNYGENIKKVSNWTLGQAVSKLKSLDYSDNKPFFSEADYELLSNITNERNYIVHSCFSDYAYIADDNERNEAFNDVYAQIQTFANKIANIWAKIEKTRIEISNKYR